jgi:hypothetical protein
VADFRKRTISDTAQDKADIDIGTSGSTHEANWGTEDAFWRDNYAHRPYTAADRGYEFYRPAYRYGCESSFTYGNRTWDDEVESDLARGWEQARGDSTSTWDQVKDAVRDAYDHACRR